MITSRVSSKDSRRDMNKVFGMLDEDKTGTISIGTLKNIVKDFGDGIDETELQEMIDKADANGDGLVTEEEFYMYMTDKRNKGWQGDLHDLD